MYSVSHRQSFFPLILFIVHHLFLDHLLKVVHLFCGIYLCASILAVWRAFRNDDRLPQMGVRQHPRLRMGGVHWQTAMEVVIRRVSPGAVLGLCNDYPQPCWIKRTYQI